MTVFDLPDLKTQYLASLQEHELSSRALHLGSLGRVTDRLPWKYISKLLPKDRSALESFFQAPVFLLANRPTALSLTADSSLPSER